MNKTTAPEDFREIDRLVRAEVEEALARFRAGDFEGKVRRRVSAEPLPGRWASLPAKLALPAAAALALLVLASVYLFDPGRPPLRTAIDAGPIAAVLRDLQPFAASAPEPAAGPAGEMGIPGSGGAIASALEAAGPWNDRGAGPDAVGAGALKGTPLTMKKRMEILFKDKVIERVLLSCAPKSKEV